MTRTLLAFFGVVSAAALAAAWGPMGDAHAPRALAAAAPLPFYYDLYTFRNDDRTTSVVAAVAVPVEGLQRERVDSRFRYRFDVRFVLADTVERVVSRSLDSVYVSMSRPLSGEHLLHTFVEIDAPPSDGTVQRIVVTDATRPGVGQLHQSPFPIPDYAGDELMLSDMAFGLPGATSGWSRHGHHVALLPTSQFPESAFDVYYEIYNLPTGRPYETEIEIERLDGRANDAGAVGARFSGESQAGPDGTLAELRRVESSLPVGRYRVSVTVTDRATGRVASSTRPIEVRGWSGGMTMLPAMTRVREAGRP
ncbi:MAG: hypothetical protein FJ207_07875 [Gemmatimonadetes bacterium]|nr:hypothetical protein [Gemmatimonadota bacterium]